MNERLMFLADELRDAANDVAEVNELATDYAASRIARVAEDLRAMAYDPRYDVEGCDDDQKNSRKIAEGRSRRHSISVVDLFL